MAGAEEPLAEARLAEGQDGPYWARMAGAEEPLAEARLAEGQDLGQHFQQCRARQSS